MSQSEARQVKVGDELFVADLRVQVIRIYTSPKHGVFFETRYGDFSASVCERAD